MRRRGGAGLAEFLVVFALTSVVLAAASRALVQHLRLERDRDAQAQADEAAREVLDVLRAEFSHAREVRVRSDTAIELSSLRIVASACDLTAARLVLPASDVWWSPPRAGDSVAVLDTLTASEWRTTIIATGTQRSSARCPLGGTRVTLAAPVPATAPVFVLPLRVWRTARYVLYRGSDGAWWLGERSCTPGCAAPQPVTGPLLSPAQGGLRFSGLGDGTGRLLAVDVTVRATAGRRTAMRSARLAVAAAP